MIFRDCFFGVAVNVNILYVAASHGSPIASKLFQVSVKVNTFQFAGVCVICLCFHHMFKGFDETCVTFKRHLKMISNSFYEVPPQAIKNTARGFPRSPGISSQGVLCQIV